MRTFLIFPMTALLGCKTTSFDAGEATLCLTHDGGQGIHGNADATWDVTGIVTDVRELDGEEIPGLDCGAEASTAVDIQETSGRTWTMAFGILDEMGEDATPPIDLSINDTINFMFRQKSGIVTSRGMLIRDGNGLVAAMDEGIGGGALENGDVEGLEVTRGLDVGESKEDCGKRAGTQITFEGSQSISLRPFSQSTLELDGGSYEVTSISSYYWAKTRCDDATDQLAWALFR